MSQVAKAEEDSSDDEGSSDELSYNTADDSSAPRIKSTNINQDWRFSMDTTQAENRIKSQCNLFYWIKNILSFRTDQWGLEVK